MRKKEVQDDSSRPEEVDSNTKDLHLPPKCSLVPSSLHTPGLIQRVPESDLVRLDAVAQAMDFSLTLSKSVLMAQFTPLNSLWDVVVTIQKLGD